jgi:hypothetical protein
VAILGWLGITAAEWVANRALDTSLESIGNINSAKTEFLNHDPKHCSHQYHLEQSLGGYLPYKEVMDFSQVILNGDVPKIRINVSEEVFYTQGNDLNWAVVRAQAYHKYRSQGHATRDSQIVRVRDILIDGDRIEMSIQPTRYFCQAESNLVLDYLADTSFEKKEEARERASLRQLLYNENPGRLPDLSDRRLANTLGVAICLLSRDGGSTLLRMVYRTGKVGVFPKGIHPAMSCAIAWNETVSSDDLMSFVMNDIEQEMQQETGMTADQYETPVPLSVCREYLRAGKPQLFALSYTDLSQKELNQLRNKQVKKNKKYRADKVEMKSSGLLWSNNPSIKASRKLVF